MNRKFIYVVLFLIISCTVREEKIEYLDVLFIEEGLTSQIPFNCDRLSHKWNSPVFSNMKIKDESFNSKFYSYMKRYKPDNNDSTYDIRIKVLIHYSNNKIDTLCLGENFNTFLNGKRVFDSPEHLKLIKGYIYKKNDF
ncbi:hypothetical protein [Tenacibaculum maritimum]|uniref:hypothetical protein n=2 Tax=Tenacibaculum maritimum TaxID=107401 RepID=UPI00388DADFF